MRAVVLAGFAVAVVTVLGVTISQHLTTTSAETSTGQMRLTVTAGGTCVGQTCTVEPGQPFILTVVADSANADGHIAFQTQVNYDALVQNGGSYTPTTQASAEVVITACGYPGISLRSNNATAHVVSHGATAGVTPCSASGGLISFAMTCSTSTSSNEFLLVPYQEPGNTLGTVWKSAAFGNPNVTPAVTNVTVNCGPTTPMPTPTFSPTDVDGDGCSNAAENGPDEEHGGRRDYLSPWDFYDPNGDGLVDLLNDIVGVAIAFGLTYSDPGYSQALDRSPPPPPWVEPDPAKRDPWDMGPPDGIVDLLVDIFGVADQFGHDCT